jgi:hypothetical protein
VVTAKKNKILFLWDVTAWCLISIEQNTCNDIQEAEIVLNISARTSNLTHSEEKWDS